MAPLGANSVLQARLGYVRRQTDCRWPLPYVSSVWTNRCGLLQESSVAVYGKVLTKKGECSVIPEASLPVLAYEGRIMKKLNINVLALMVSLAVSTGAMAEGISKEAYKADKEKIEMDYKTAKAACNSLSGNANDICVAEAKGKESVSYAELDASYKPSRKAHYQTRVAVAEADYAVAKERCDDKSGNAKDICVKEAKAKETAAKADATAQMKTSDANDTANEKTADARQDANKKSVDARKDATAEKTDAQYSLAKEKCDTYAAAAKDRCLSDAKARFGK